MKPKYFILIGILILASIACHKEIRINYGFSTEIGQNDRGLVIMDVKRDMHSVYLFGRVTLDEGRIEAELVRPDGTTAWSKALEAPVELDVSEIFPADRGYWSLKYRSYGGRGYINLHMEN